MKRSNLIIASLISLTGSVSAFAQQPENACPATLDVGQDTYAFDSATLRYNTLGQLTVLDCAYRNLQGQEAGFETTAKRGSTYAPVNNETSNWETVASPVRYPPYVTKPSYVCQVSAGSECLLTR